MSTALQATGCHRGSVLLPGQSLQAALPRPRYRPCGTADLTHSSWHLCQMRGKEQFPGARCGRGWGWRQVGVGVAARVSTAALASSNLQPGLPPAQLPGPPRCPARLPARAHLTWLGQAAGSVAGLVWVSDLGQGLGHQENGVESGNCLGPGLLTSTWCCGQAGSEARLCKYSFRCTAGDSGAGRGGSGRPR